MSELIGKRFRRNKYGPSIWEDRVREVIYVKVKPKISLEDSKDSEKWTAHLTNVKKTFMTGPYELKPAVLGTNTFTKYFFDEIIFYND